MKITATSERVADEVGSWKTYKGNNWSAVRLVAWIFQDKSTLKSTIYFKWQSGADNYYCYWKDRHNYSVTLDGKTINDSFALPKTSNGWSDLSTAKTIEVAHDSNGNFTGSLSVSGYKFWEAFSETISIELPKITSSTTPVTPDDPSVPTVNDKDPRFFVYADKKLLYSVDVEKHAILNPRLTLELNKTDSFEFTLPETNELYSSLDKLRTTIEVRQGSEILFRGRVLDDELDFNKRKKVHCEGALAFLGDTFKKPYSETQYLTIKDYFKACIDEHTQQVPVATPYRKLKYVRCNMSTEYEGSSEDYQTTADCITSIVEQAGGYLKLEYYDDGTTGISLLNSYDHMSKQTIQFGRNLMDLSMTIDASGVYTSVVALGAADEETGIRITTGDGNDIYTEDPAAIELFGRIIRVFEYDEITDRPSLQKMALDQLKLGLNVSLSISVTAIDLHLVDGDQEKIRLGDYVRVISEPHGIDSYFQCVKISLDFQNPGNSVYTFGSTAQKLTDLVKKK